MLRSWWIFSRSTAPGSPVIWRRPAQSAPTTTPPTWWAWMPSAQRFTAERRRDSAVLPDAGLAVLRSGDAWMCLSAGPNGQGGTGGHGHNDKNSVELSFGSFDVLVDRGTYVYARDPQERNARRGTVGHNTVQVDGLEQNRIIPGRLFALPDTARAGIAAMER